MKKEKFNVFRHKKDGGIQEVEGYVITFPKPFDAYAFGVTKTSDGWMVIEFTTGLWIVMGIKTKREALSRAYSRLQKNSTETLNTAIKRSGHDPVNVR
jgi:hypothetical protein